jgi:hypothetical protein
MRNHLLAELTFGREGNALPYLAYGWSAPEDGFTWTDGAEAGLYIPVRCDTEHRIALELTGTAYQPENGPALTVTAVVNGQTTAPTHFVRDSYAWTLDVAQPHQAMLVTLSLPRASRPSEWGNDDPRRLGIAVRRLRVFALNEPREAVFRPHTGAVPADPELAIEFVSLGDDAECGFVQRALGGDSPSLLRFSMASLPHVLRGIDANWEALGDGLHVAVEGDEWVARESGYDLRWHTFLDPDAATADALLRTEQAKTALLQRKMIDDVAHGDRIFVVKSTEPAQYEQILALHLALNRIALNWLLWVVADGHPAGSVEILAPRLLRGRVSRFMQPGGADDYLLAEWRALLSHAWIIAKGDGIRVGAGAL